MRDRSEELDEEACSSAKSKAENLLKKLNSIINAEIATQDPLSDVINSIKALKEIMEQEIISDSLNNIFSQSQQKKDEHISKIVNCVDKTYQELKELSGTSLNQGQLQTLLSQIETLANEAQGRPSRGWQYIGAALIVVGAAITLAATLLIVLSALTIVPSFGGSSGAFVLGAFSASVGVTALTLGVEKVISNSSHGISHQLRLFGDSIEKSNKAQQKKSIGEILTLPLETLYKKFIR